MSGAGIRILALALLGWTIFTLQRVAAAGGLTHGMTRHRPLAFAALALAALALLTAAALWSRSSGAFSLYALWAVAAMGTFVLLRLASGATHLVRFMPSILTLGLVFAGGAILLRRAV